ncbi:MAG: winged helix DNA-binding protein [Novosphingobium sp.]|nr:winged helix DNA-binding protein [Novosphingobium sp.]
MKPPASKPSAGDLRELAEKLLCWSKELERDDGTGQEQRETDDQLLIIAAKYYQSRRDRDDLFPKEIFGEPAWDILLDLFVNARRQRPVSTTSLCIASGAPATTALRHIAMLEKRGLVRRVRAQHDGRVHYVELTEEANRMMEEHLTDAARRIRDLASD